MKKKITVGTSLIVMLLAVLLTFQLTYSFVGMEYQAKVDTLTKTQADFSLLAEADGLIRENFLGKIDDEKIEDGMIKGYISELADDYSVYLTKEEYDRYQKENAPSGNGIGVRLTFDSGKNQVVVYNVFESSPAAEKGILKGDILTKVNDEEVSEIGFYGTLAALSAEEGTKLHLSVKREIAAQVLEMDFDLTVGKVTPNSLDYKMLGEIGYIQIFSFDEGFKKQFDSAVTALTKASVQGIIFDVRNTTGGDASEALRALDKLLPEGDLVHTTDQSGKKKTVKSDESFLDLPFAVLINENTAFSAEIFAATMKDYGVDLVGTTTYGKSLEQKVLPLTNGSALLLSDKAYTPPVSPSFEDVGVEPDIVCELGAPNFYLLEQEADVQLQEAYRCVMNH